MVQQRQPVVGLPVEAEDNLEASALVQRTQEEASLMVPVIEQRRRRTALAALALVLGTVGAFVVRRSLFAPCVPRRTADAATLVSLVEAYPEDLVNFVEVGGNEDALLGWLAAATGAGEAAEDVKSVKDAPNMSEVAIVKQAEASIEKALNSSDPQQAAKLASEAMYKAVGRNKEKRQQLKDLAGMLNISGKTAASALGAGAGAVAAASPAKKEFRRTKQKTATCVINALSMTTGVATLASNVNDVAKTCEGVDFKTFMTAGSNETHAKVCSVNAAAMIAGFANLATSLATAANSCSRTLIPNVDAMCSASVTGLLTSTSALAGSFTLIAAACREKGWYYHIPPGLTPSNVGSNERMEERDDDELEEPMPSQPHRRLREGGVAASAAQEQPKPQAPPRKLLFGGGKGSLATQCATEIMGIGWALADIGLALNSMTNEKMGATCPPKDMFGGDSFKGPIYKLNQGVCSVDVSALLVSFFSIIAFGQLIAVTCTDTLNLPAICGGGITGVFAGAAGIAQTGTGLWLACDVAQLPIVHDVIMMGRELDWMSGYKISDIMDNGLFANLGVASSVDTFGRRLKPESRIAELKEKYGSPTEIWKSLGYNLEDSNAEWRKAHSEPRLSAEDLSLLVQESAEPGTASSGGLFSRQDTCEG